MDHQPIYSDGRDYFLGLAAFGGGALDVPAFLPLSVTCLNVLPMAGPIFGISSSMFFAALLSPRPISSRVSPWFGSALPEDSGAASTRGASV